MNIAKQIVRTSLAVNDQDIVHVSASPHTLNLAFEVAQEVERAGGELYFTLWGDDLFVTEMREVSDEYLKREPRVEKELAELVTAEIHLAGIADPKVFDRSSPARMSLGAEHSQVISERKRARGVREAFVGLSQVTPQRARKYGVSYPKWKRIVTAALGANLNAIRTKGQLAAKNLDGAPKVHLTGPGTDLRMSLSGRSAIVEDGIVDASDIQRGFPYTSLPTGWLAIAPVENSVNGRVTFDPFPLWGKWVKGPTWEFRDGKLASFAASQNEKLFRQFYDAGVGDKDRLGWLSIGLNPKATYLGAFVDSFVPGAVSLSLGENVSLGGTNKGPFSMSATIRGATLKTDGFELVKNGKVKV